MLHEPWLVVCQSHTLFSRPATVHILRDRKPKCVCVCVRVWVCVVAGGGGGRVEHASKRDTTIEQQD